MINLQTLAIYDTEISGLIPAELGLCTELRDLYLHMNRLTSPILHELGRLLKLTSLFLWGNSLTGVKLLLYNHIPNGNLQQLLQSNRNLDWETRYEIAFGSAQGLCNTPKI
ncbi:putative non-specific serine/threonine protein kinase [Helianthus annuus]|nr:putative non-specific serine/threonine protein kinase [Helianthus annuus]KAJ0575033.1 putative non-specific serine/threonine protein kinase [Helianthus annuus]